MRLFVGIALPASVTDRLAGLASGLPNARWVAAENQHLTLRFIGEVDGGAMRDIATALAQVHGPPLSLALDGLGVFGSLRNARTLWAGVTPCPALDALQARIETALVAMGLEPEHRKFNAHVTVARLKGATAGRLGQYLSANGMFRTEPFAADAFHLYSSALTQKGAMYRIESSYALQEGE